MNPMSPSPSVVKTTANLIRDMSDRLGEVTGSVRDVILNQIPELRGDPQLVDLLRDSVEGNIDTIFAAIQHGIGDNVSTPTAALEYARRLAQHEVSPNALVRAYRLGQQELLRVLLLEIRNRELPAEDALAVFEWVNISASRYIDWVSEQVVDVYQDERDRWRATRDRVLAERVHAVLALQRSGSAEELSAFLRYPVHRHHLAVIAWYDAADAREQEIVGLSRFITGAGIALGAEERPLFFAQDKVTGWAWIPLLAHGAVGAAERLRRLAENDSAAPSLAIGSPCAGVIGFRRSHVLAQQARTVALGRHLASRQPVASSDPGVVIAAMLHDGLDSAPDWIVETLGDLAAPTDSDALLRDTVRTYLNADSSLKETAAQLHLHPNTVKYRIQKAAERRGRPLTDDRLDVEIALLLCDRFPELTPAARAQ